MNIKLRYKKPEGDVSKLLQHPVMDNNSEVSNTSGNLRFACAVAQFGMLLRNSEYKGKSNYHHVLQLAQSVTTEDKDGYRKEFVELVKKARKLSKNVAVKDEESLEEE
jgi:Ca-activated chloride channel family protein